MPSDSSAIDDFAYPTAEIRKAHLAHIFSFEECIGEAVHAGRGPFTEPTNLVGWQAETHVDAKFAEELFDRITWIVTEHALAVVTGEVSAGKTVAEAGAR